jgi:uncharacterized membrane protein
VESEEMQKSTVIAGIVGFIIGFFVSPLTTTLKAWLMGLSSEFAAWLTLMGTDWNRAFDLAIAGFYGTSVRILVLVFSILPIVIVLLVIWLVYRHWKRKQRERTYEERN